MRTRLTDLAALRALVVFIALSAMSGSAIAIWREYVALEEGAIVELRTINRLLSAYVSAENRIAEVQLEQLVALVRRVGDPSKAMADEGIWAQLRQIAAQQPETDSVWLYGPDKKSAHNTLNYRDRLDTSDREFVRGAERTAGVFIGAMFRGRIDGKMKRELTRRVLAPDGTLLGYAGVDIFTRPFADYLSGLKPGHVDARYGVVRTDGSVVLRYPVPTEDLPLGALADSVAAFSQTEGTYRRGQADGSELLVAYQKMPDYPLYVLSAIGLPAIRASFYKSNTVRLAAGGFLGFALVAATALSVVRRAARTQAELARALLSRDEALRHKDLMFQEVHHRVKNNLQIVSSLLQMQSLGDGSARAMLQAANARIQAIGMIHQQIYNQDDPEHVRFDAYLERLASYQNEALGLSERGIVLSVEAEPAALDLDQALAAGLIVNEALSNVAKHAFAGGDGGSVRVGLQLAGGVCRVSVADNGRFVPGRRSGLGSRLMRGLADQLGGIIDISHEAGTMVTLAFRLDGGRLGEGTAG